MKKNVIIKHIPNGLNDPYQHFQYERYPRDPQEDDLVIIKAEIITESSLDEVLLEWKLNNTKQQPIYGKLIKDFVNENEYYQFEIGRFKVGDKINYQIEVFSGNENYRSEIFSFTTGTSYYYDNLLNISHYNNGVKVELQDRDSNIFTVHFLYENGYLRIINSKEKLMDLVGDQAEFVKIDKNNYILKTNKSSVEFSKNPFSFVIKDSEGNEILKSPVDILNYLMVNDYDNKLVVGLNLESDYSNIYGLGERYNKLNQKGFTPDFCVYNQYLDQQDKTYIPIPFFLTTAGYGIFLPTSRYLKFDLGNKYNNIINIEGQVDIINPYLEMVIFFGTPEEILQEYFKQTGFPVLPPKWAFGPWMSANSWNSQQKVIEEINNMNELKIPATVFVIEAWSDEATFYIFNDAEYQPKEKESFIYADFNFPENGKWPDPKGLINFIHKNDLKLILWQIPIIKALEEGRENLQHGIDEDYVIKNKLCVMNPDGTPYRIPDGWFENSLLIDFNNLQARKWWFDKRRYLLDELEVDGFKTDGGEFIFDDNLVFADGKRGDEMRNLYPLNYIKAYNEFGGNECITFSRAGFTGLQKYPLYWGGDQLSSFDTLKRLLVAGLSMNISGNPFWGWDIAGFSGEIPTVELFIRSTQMAAFCPVMQFHSENYLETTNWERTPWNIAERTADKKAIDLYRKYANLRMNMLPYIYNEALFITEVGQPLMRALVYEYPHDEMVYNIEDEYLFGRNLLIAPIVEEGKGQREVYLPEGKWFDFWSLTEYDGNRIVKVLADLSEIPVFIRNNSVIALNLNNLFQVSGFVGNNLKEYENLCFMVIGEEIDYQFADDLGNVVKINAYKNNLKVNITGNLEEVYILSTKEYNLGNITKIKRDGVYSYRIEN